MAAPGVAPGPGPRARATTGRGAGRVHGRDRAGTGQGRVPGTRNVQGQAAPEAAPGAAAYTARTVAEFIAVLDGIVVFDRDLSHFREKKARLSIHSIVFEQELSNRIALGVTAPLRASWPIVINPA